ncbi:tRNA pseudouridine55 synthase [Leucobacter aridicollis]|uniref:tRNA pseudouridine synthase B n=2 Tax=Leucobacter aridicollis TaxID=283878 RepID=A0A852RFV1_9MICO|nr:tRNA pseudouridine(55) synthase TruB [Leucobacter aridicollis]NYD25582.1 tRNA pseudouridine55 synthase [Leucobacter aridicollis]
MKFADMPQGAILLVDKVEGWTSHDVVAKSRRALGTKKVGHAGTLDPMATGLLVLGAGPATRLLTYLVGLDKTYTTTIRLGLSTVTDDREGDITATAPAGLVAEVFADQDRITAGVANLTGPIEQAPSSVSAIRVDGKRAYDRVRAGEEVVLKKRPVTIHGFDIGEPRILSVPGPDGEPVEVIDIDAVVRCTTGTYIRALARDLGEALGVGGHLTALRRTAVGPFSVDAATPHARLVGDGTEAGDPGRLYSPADIARTLFPVLELGADEAKDLADGKRLNIDPDRHAPAPLVAAILPGGDGGSGSDRLVGLVVIKGGRTHILTNFPSQQPGGAA